MAAPQDELRRLDSLGLSQVEQTALKLAEWPLSWTPQHALVSAAQRTQDTFQRLCASWSRPDEMSSELNQELYLAGPERWVQSLELLSAEQRVVLCVGHNPGISDLIYQLSGAWVSLEVAEAVGLEVRDQASWSGALSAPWTLKGRVKTHQAP